MAISRIFWIIWNLCRMSKIVGIQLHRRRSAAAALTSRKSLMEEADDMEELIAAMNEDEDCKDIRHVDGQKDIYYYSEENMANNYAMIAALVEEKDACRTIAHMVRFAAAALRLRI